MYVFDVLNKNLFSNVSCQSCASKIRHCFTQVMRRRYRLSDKCCTDVGGFVTAYFSLSSNLWVCNMTRGRKRFRTKWQQAFTEMKLLLTSSRICRDSGMFFALANNVNVIHVSQSYIMLERAKHRTRFSRVMNGFAEFLTTFVINDHQSVS